METTKKINQCASGTISKKLNQKKKMLAAAALAALCGASSSHAALIGQWIGDNYSSGNWLDSSGNNNNGVINGAPFASPSSFGTHTGVTFTGTDYFTVPNSNTVLVGASALTIAAVFNPSSANTSSGGQFWQKAGLVGNEQPGGVADWGLGFGASQADFGIGGPDTTLLSPTLNVGTPHVIVGTWTTAGTMTLYVDGAQVAQSVTAPTPTRTANAFGSFALGANLAAVNGDLKPFVGSIAELRVYNDVATDPIALSNSLTATYILGLSGTNTWLPAASGNFNSAGSWSAGHAPITGEQAIIPTGATVTVNADQGQAFGVKITNGALTMASGGALFAGIDLAPGNGPGTATLNLNGGTLTAPFFLIDSGTTGGTGTKAINFNGGTLATTGSFTVSGTNLTTSIGANGATIDTQGTSVVTWKPALVLSAGASLTKLGSGTLNYTAGGFAGALNVKAGILSVAGDVGTAASTIKLGDFSVPGGDFATLTFTTPTTVLSPITVGTTNSPAGGYTLNVAANATVAFPRAITLNQSLTIATAATTGTNGTALAGGVTATGPNLTLTFDNAGPVTVATNGINNGTGTLALQKNNNGILVLQAPNTYSLGTTINGGAIVFNAPNTVGGTGANVTINQAGVAAVGTGFTYTNLKGTFFNRVDPNSTGAVALLADSAENFDFSPTGLNMPSLFFGGATNVAYTGTITPANNSYNLYAAIGNFTLSKTNAITGSNALVVNGALNGAVLLAQPNDFTNGTTINVGGMLAVANGDRLGTGGVSLAGGTLQVIGTTPATIPQSIILTLGGGIRADNASANFTNDIISVGQGQFIRSGTGTANFNGSVILNQTVPLFNEGTSVFSGTSALSAANYFSIGQGASNVATAVFQGNSTATIGTDFNVSDTANSIGKMIVRDSATITAQTLYIGKGGTSDGSVLQSGGSIVSAGTPAEWRVGGGTGPADNNAVGSYTMTGGTLTTTANYQVGSYGRGTMTMLPVASATMGGFDVVGRFNGSYGVMSINGATFTHNNPATFVIVGESGAGRLNVGGSGSNVGLLSLVTPLRIGLNADGEGHVNLLTGGNILTPGVVAGGSTNGSTFNFHGGTLTATTPAVSLITGVKTVVYSEGGIIDTAGNDVSLSASMIAPTGQGLSSVQLATGGVGYVSHPVVEITGGGGKGATAVPVLNANGVVTGITITNPGTDYTSAPTITLKGGGATTPATLGTVALANNVSGGITKKGAGVLTLSGFNTYTGPTTIAGGTIKLPVATTLSPTAIWNADSLSGNTGDAVTTWTDSIAGKNATQNGANALPTLTKTGLGTHNTVHFAGANSQSLQVADVDSPIAGTTNFSIAIVFKTSNAGVGGEGQWYQNTGLVDAEQGGTTEDWGLVLNSNGRVGAGVGAPNADRTIYSSNSGLANGAGHVAIFTRSDTSAFTITVDGQTVTGASGDTLARNINRFLFGGIQTNGNFYTGDLAQVQMFNGALSPSQINSLGTTLSSTYGITNGFSAGSFLPQTSPIVISDASGVLDLSDSAVTIGSLAGVTGGQVLMGAGAITLGADNTSPTFSGTISGTGNVTKIGTGVQTFASAQTYTGATAVNDGTLRVTGSINASSGVTVTAATATFEAGATQTVKNLTITAGQAKVTRTGAPVTVLVVGDNVNPTPLSISATGKIDLTNNAAVVDVPAANQTAALSLVRSKILSGFNGGNYHGNGISSSSITDGTRGIGYAQPSEVVLQPGNKFLGQTVDSSSVLIRFTVNGDADLDGTVGFADLVALSQHYGQNLNDPVGSPATFTNSTWTHGDFNYDGTVGFADLVSLSQNYGGVLPAAIPGASVDFNNDLAAAFASVPEPSSMMLLVGAAGLSLNRRVRSRRRTQATSAQ